MKTSIGSHLAVVMTAFLVSTLSACGGGGGGGTSVPVTPPSVTVTCPDGSSQTAATTTTADANCPAPSGSAIFQTSPSPDSFTPIKVKSTSTLDSSKTSVTLVAGSSTTVGIAIPVTLTFATDNKSFTFVPAAKLNYGQQYSFTANLVDSLGHTGQIPGTFTTAAIATVVSENVWQVLNPQDILPADCVPPDPSVTPAPCWYASLSAGTTLSFATKEMGDGTSPVNVAIGYTNIVVGDQTVFVGYYVVMDAQTGMSISTPTFFRQYILGAVSNDAGVVLELQDQDPAGNISCVQLQWYPPTMDPTVTISDVWTTAPLTSCPVGVPITPTPVATSG